MQFKKTIFTFYMFATLYVIGTIAGLFLFYTTGYLGEMTALGLRGVVNMLPYIFLFILLPVSIATGFFLSANFIKRSQV